jgi:hypothetical protein
MKVCTSVGVAIALTLALGGCGQQPQDSSSDNPVAGRRVSAADMAVLLPDNSMINTVSYAITGPNMFSRMGTVNVANSRTIKFRVSDLPVSTMPYSISITATTSNGVMCTGGPTTFVIANNNVTAVMMSLMCGNDEDNNGDLQVTADIDGNCPAISGISALPGEAFIGNDIALHVSHSAGGTGRIMWAGAGGSFSDAMAAGTNFRCLTVGTHTVTVTLTEGTECTTSFSADVECSDGGIDLDVCGDGDLDGVEECDDSNTTTEACAYGLQSCVVCSSTCRNVPGATAYCGDGVTNTANGEGCDDGNMTTEACPVGQTACTVCAANCQLVPGGTSFCGDGVTDTGAGEQCDDSNSMTETCAYGLQSCTVCNATCQSVPGATSYCGDGVTDTANGEQCDGGANCDTMCRTTGPTGPGTGIAHARAGCADCRTANCTDVDFSGINALDRCFTAPDGSVSPADAQLCVDVLDCAFTNNCAYTSAGMQGCWCTATPAVCQSTAGLDANHGVCFDRILAATKALVDLPSGTRDQQLDAAIIRFSQDAYPSGAAFWMLQCDRNYCTGSCTP